MVRKDAWNSRFDDLLRQEEAGRAGLQLELDKLKAQPPQPGMMESALMMKIELVDENMDKTCKSLMATEKKFDNLPATRLAQASLPAMPTWKLKLLGSRTG